MNHKFTVSVYIPVFNEEANIIYLLDSIINQATLSFRLEKIVVVNDGSTDETAEKVKKYAKKHKIIRLLSDGLRLGKIERLNQVYNSNSSEIIVIFDGDILLSNPLVIDKMIRIFNDSQTTIVGANKMPVKARNFIEKLINYWYVLTYEISNNLDNKDNIHNFSSCAFALRNNFAKNIYYPKNIYPITKFTFFAAVSKKYKVKFAKDAVIFFRSPDNIRDYISQINRFSNVNQKVAAYYGDWVYEFIKIPFSRKISAVLYVFIHQPFYTLLAIIFRYSIKFISYKFKFDNRIWESVKSSKIAIR